MPIFLGNSNNVCASSASILLSDKLYRFERHLDSHKENNSRSRLGLKRSRPSRCFCHVVLTTLYQVVVLVLSQKHIEILIIAHLESHMYLSTKSS